MDTRKMWILGAVAILLLAGAAAYIATQFIDRAGEQQPAATSTYPYLHQFSDYQVSDSFRSAPAAVDFSTYPAASEFEAVISEEAKKGPNFADAYTVITWGCGTSCQYSAIVSANTGAVVEFGVMSEYGLEYYLDSSLLITNPPKAFKEMPEAPYGVKTKYYRFVDGDLILLDEQRPGDPGPLFVAEPPADPVPVTPAPAQPVPAAKCYVGGCSSQLCSDQPDMVSTCEWNEIYACYRTATCERQSNGQCGWTPTPTLQACLNQHR